MCGCRLTFCEVGLLCASSCELYETNIVFFSYYWNEVCCFFWKFVKLLKNLKLLWNGSKCILTCFRTRCNLSDKTENSVGGTFREYIQNFVCWILMKLFHTNEAQQNYLYCVCRKCWIHRTLGWEEILKQPWDTATVEMSFSPGWSIWPLCTLAAADSCCRGYAAQPDIGDVAVSCLRQMDTVPVQTSWWIRTRCCSSIAAWNRWI